MKKLNLILAGILGLSSFAFASDAAAIFKSKCQACHGANGQMKAMGKSALINGLSSAAISTDLKGYRAGTTNKYGLGAVMKTQASTLSDADIEALAKYIPTLKK